MKLYKFLLITDKVVQSEMKCIIEGNYNDYWKNSIYLLNNEIGYDHIRFMRFRYPNGGYNQWAYVIIDGDAAGKLSKYKWGTTKDKIGNNHQSKADKPYSNPYRVVDIDKTKPLIDGLEAYNQDYRVELITQYRYVKMGGWLNNTQPETGFLHKYIISDFGKNKIDNKLRIHHKGHTFDNRKAFLKEVSIGKHRIIHNKWEMDTSLRTGVEPNCIFNRAEKIVLGDSSSKDLECGACNKDCKQCSGVLLIDTVEKLVELLKIITGSEYRKLAREKVYSDIK